MSSPSPQIPDGALLSATTKRRLRVRAQRGSALFIKGPIDLSWLRAAHRAGRSALAVALAIHFVRGLRRGAVIRLSVRKLGSIMGTEPRTTQRALRDLEAARLIMTTREPGRSLTVRIVPVPIPSSAGDTNSTTQPETMDLTMESL